MTSVVVEYSTNITPPQLDLLRVIAAHIDHGFAPSMGELARDLNTGRGTVRARLLSLEKRRLITRKSGSRRGIAITREGRALVPWRGRGCCPTCGTAVGS